MIYVDADAMPRDAMLATKRLSQAYKATLVTVSSINHQIVGENHITVDAHPQAVDMKIVSLIERDAPTVVLTQDYGLAALVLAKGASAISPAGFEFTEFNMDRLLFERAIHAHERKLTGRNRGPKPRSTEQTRQFEKSLERVLQRLIGQGSSQG